MYANVVCYKKNSIFACANNQYIKLFVEYFFVMKLNNNNDSHNSGLNLLVCKMVLDIESHPAWVCGLKHCSNPASGTSPWSHPAWLCKLKHCSPVSQIYGRAWSGLTH